MRRFSKCTSLACRCMDPAIWGNGYSGFIYFVQMERIGPIKIGYSKNPSTRLRELQGGNPYKLRTIYITPGSQSDERGIHNGMALHAPDLSLTGEWYLPGEIIFETISDFMEMDKRDSEWEERDG